MRCGQRGSTCARHITLDWISGVWWFDCDERRQPAIADPLPVEMIDQCIVYHAVSLAVSIYANRICVQSVLWFILHVYISLLAATLHGRCILFGDWLVQPVESVCRIDMQQCLYRCTTYVSHISCCIFPLSNISPGHHCKYLKQYKLANPVPNSKSTSLAFVTFK